MNRPTHATPGGHAYLELQSRARVERVGTQELLVWYVHERFLYRLSRSSWPADSLKPAIRERVPAEAIPL